MAETVGVMARDEEDIQNNSDDEDPFLNCDAVMASPGCSSSPLLASLNEEKGSSAVPERLSVLSTKAMVQATFLSVPEMVSGGQAQRTSSGLAEHPPRPANTLGGSWYPGAVGNLQPVGIASLCSKSSCCNDNPSSEALQVPRVSSESLQAVAVLPGSNPEACHMPQAGTDMMSDTAPDSLGWAIWMKPAKVTETLEKKKKEEKEKYRLQLAMYRRLLLLRSIRSLHKQLEQQQARLQECYGMVINTKKEVLKHIRSTSPSPAP